MTRAILPHTAPATAASSPLAAAFWSSEGRAPGPTSVASPLPNYHSGRSNALRFVSRAIAMSSFRKIVSLPRQFWTAATFSPVTWLDDEGLAACSYPRDD